MLAPCASATERFNVTHLRGCVVGELKGVVAYDDKLQPALVFLKPVDRPWRHFFLDVGAGFGEQWSDCENADTRVDDSYKHVDYAELFGLRGALIKTIDCGPVADEGSSQILARLSCGVVTLAPQDPRNWESPSKLSFTK